MPTSESRPAPFWKRLKLEEMSRDQWESLCDGCAKCCLHKLEDEDTGELYYTNVACRLLDLKTLKCTRYLDRQRYVPDCKVLDPENVPTFNWMPKTCAYRLLAEGEGLPVWHPLRSGKAASVHEAGISIKGRVVSERRAGPLEHHLLDPEKEAADKPA
ncbi:MAG: YcgN family cysteine cluster protein [Sphingomonadales bacterium]